MGAKQSRDGNYVYRNSFGRGPRSTTSPHQSDQAEASFFSQTRMEVQSRYGRIGDNYQTLDQVSFICSNHMSHVC